MSASGYGKYYGSEPSEYQYVQKTETFLEEQYKRFSGTDKLGVLNIAALISLAFGVQSGKEVVAGAFGLSHFYFSGGDGLDGVIAAMSGIQLAKKRWKTVAFPLVLESLRTMKDLTKGKRVTKVGISRTVIFVAGYLAAMSRMV